MNTDALIEALARDAAPLPRNMLERRFGGGLAAGVPVALLAVVVVLGMRPDLAAAAGAAMFWGKASYTLALGLIGLMLAAQLARPDSLRLRRSWLIALPLGLLFLASAAELASAAPGTRAAMVTAPGWTCVPLILMLAIPIFGGLVWALRRMAPTRLRAAGAAAGLAAGGLAATLYCLYCQQMSPAYVLTRYTAAIALASALGALLGPRLLRW